jgi:RNA polymerase sigma factor (sigma-70 family)
LSGGLQILVSSRILRPRGDGLFATGGEFAMTMMAQPEVDADLAKVLQAAHHGDQAAWETLFKECYPKVRRVVRRKLNRSLRSLYDSTDFASDVMKSLAAHFDRLHFPSIDSLMAFLAQVAEQKVIDEHRRRHTLKRDITRERPISANESEAGPVQLPSTDPTASQLAQAHEVQERLLSQTDETGRTIIKLKYQGYSNSDIALQTGLNIRWVQRYLKDLCESVNDSGA